MLPDNNGDEINSKPSSNSQPSSRSNDNIDIEAIIDTNANAIIDANVNANNPIANAIIDDNVNANNPIDRILIPVSNIIDSNSTSKVSCNDSIKIIVSDNVFSSPSLSNNNGNNISKFYFHYTIIVRVSDLEGANSFE